MYDNCKVIFGFGAKLATERRGSTLTIKYKNKFSRLAQSGRAVAWYAKDQRFKSFICYLWQWDLFLSREALFTAVTLSEYSSVVESLSSKQFTWVRFSLLALALSTKCGKSSEVVSNNDWCKILVWFTGNQTSGRSYARWGLAKDHKSLLKRKQQPESIKYGII